MDTTLIILSSIVGAALAAPITWLIAARRVQTERERAIRAESALEAAHHAHTQQVAMLHDAEQRVRDTFANLSNEALKASSTQFLQLAEEHLQRHQQTAKSDLSSLVEPLRNTLTRQEQHVKALEEARQIAYGSLDELLRGLRQDQQSLRTQTDTLARSLRNPQVRGRWGEIQLRRLIELAGMLNHCDFTEQATVSDPDRKHQRPDLYVSLPNKRGIIVDAKVPLERFLDAMEAPEPEREQYFREHARSIRNHVDEMAKRAYHKQFNDAHEFTVIFIPGEVFYQTALEYDHELLEYALRKDIILASPNTLIAVLKSAAMGWKETQLAADAHKIQETGREIYARMETVVEHMRKLGRNLTQSIEAYNTTVGSIEGRLLVSARKMHAQGIGSNELPELPPLHTAVRAITHEVFPVEDNRM